MPQHQNILVLGGTGFVGRALCEKLVARNGGAGGRITVPTRQLARANKIRSLPTVEVTQANIHDDTTLARLVAGHDVVINLVAILHGTPDSFARVHVGLPRRLVAACTGAGVRRVLHVSALGAAINAPSHYLRSKAAGEAAFSHSELDLSFLRPSVIFGAEDRFLNLFASLQAFAPVMPLAGSHAKFQPVWVQDVASALLRCIDDENTVGKTYELAGPTVYTLSELVRLAGRWSGHERAQLPLPAPLATLQALALELLPGEPLMSRDNLASMRVPNVALGQLPGLSQLGILATALEAVAPQYLGHSNGRARLNRLRAGAGRD
jgi:uncharacterized protein YbjT (DUF2867 family)